MTCDVSLVINTICDYSHVWTWAEHEWKYVLRACVDIVSIKLTMDHKLYRDWEEPWFYSFCLKKKKKVLINSKPWKFTQQKTLHHTFKRVKDSERFPHLPVFSTCIWTCRHGVHENVREVQKWWGEDSECCLLWTKTWPFCWQLVKAAEDESERSPLTGAPVALSPARFHLASLAQGKYGEKECCMMKPSPPCPLG